MRDFFIGSAKNFKFAIRGMFSLLKTEHTIISHFPISIVFIAMGFVLAVESINTVVEKTSIYVI